MTAAIFPQARIDDRFPVFNFVLVHDFSLPPFQNLHCLSLLLDTFSIEWVAHTGALVLPLASLSIRI